ncbi:S16 family serine protease [Echinimonas agarilytica]|uniref:endopeptidase La n=1 Tax=Echinimonas agarilytica TaxID=1215918 RepID=A0AA42B8L6_9GAMM|nr:S16 family serine protease [Echinimonas agarilytica]MCM2681175.1 AAA family ATPase [Echinimonas agarilytica]
MMASVHPFPLFNLQDSHNEAISFGQTSVSSGLSLAFKLQSSICLATVEGIAPLDVCRLIADSSEQTLTECTLATIESLLGQYSYNNDQWSFNPGLLARKGEYITVWANQLLEDPQLITSLAASVSTGTIQVPLAHLHRGVPFTAQTLLVGSNIIVLGSHVELAELETYWPNLYQDINLTAEFYDRIAVEDAQNYVGFLKGIAKSSHQTTLNADAIDRLLRLSSRWAGHSGCLSLQTSKFKHLLREASAYSDQSSLSAQDIQVALSNIEKRTLQLARDSYRDFVEGTMKLQVTGDIVGQVNGLTVVEVGDIAYGEPARITATVHYGDGDVIDIERKAELAGNIHAKGTMILAAYVAQIFGKDAPLHLSANIVFEQSYYEVDGDSASLAELVALMSALARIPVHQSMAVTGAIDQFGYVQAIGGINEKIEGFYTVASMMAPNHSFSIVMPKSNLIQLNLNDTCAEAVQNGRLKIHTVEHVSEAVELLMSTPSGAGAENEVHQYPKGTVFAKVHHRLGDLAEPDDERIGLLGLIRSFFSR